MIRDNKIGTLTFHRAINYGAILQTYALQKSIKVLGYDTEVVDYRSDFLESLHNPYSLKKYRTPVHFLNALLKNRIKKDNRKVFREFLRKNINVSSVVYDKNNLKTAEENYSAFIVGSDQVWNHNCTKFDKTYFLDFVYDANKKYSYAASIGVKLESDEVKKEYKRLLNDYKILNVREEQGKNELTALGLNANVALDPTLLLDKNAWIKLAKKPSKVDENQKYLLVYLIVETPTIFEISKKIAKEHNLKIIYINEMIFNKMGVKNLKCVTPEEWIWLFANAEFIVTNSFHGTAFSVNFEKQFLVEPLPVKTNVNSRIYDFLDMLDLSNRIVEHAGISCSNKRISYSDVSIKEKRQESLNVLKKTLRIIKNNGLEL